MKKFWEFFAFVWSHFSGTRHVTTRMQLTFDNINYHSSPPKRFISNTFQWRNRAEKCCEFTFPLLTLSTIKFEFLKREHLRFVYLSVIQPSPAPTSVYTRLRDFRCSRGVRRGEKKVLRSDVIKHHESRFNFLMGPIKKISSERVFRCFHRCVWLKIFASFSSPLCCKTQTYDS